MKFPTVVPVMALISGGAQVATAADGAKCKDKAEKCDNRVTVVATDFISGLKKDVPAAVFNAFVAASTDCLHCVDKSDAVALYTDDNSQMSYNACKYVACWCCHLDWCENGCQDQCLDRFPECANDERRVLMGGGADFTERSLADTEDAAEPHTVSFEISVCMDDIYSLKAGETDYSDYKMMLADFEKELSTCYADKDAFYNSWSSYAADSGIDLGLMTREEGEGGSSKITFSAVGLDIEDAVVVSSVSDESHRSTSNMMFYSALGFVTLSAFAIFGTAVVVRVLNNRKAREEEQAAQWVAELTSQEM